MCSSLATRLRRRCVAALFPSPAPTVNVVVQLASMPAAQFSWWTWFLDKMAGPLAAGLVIAALGSWLIAQINERYRGRREHMSKAVDALRTQVEALVRVCGEYWSVGYSPKKSPGQVAEILYRLDDIDSLTRICAEQLWQDQADAGPRMVGALLGAIVTPEFGTTRKVADPARLEAVVRAAATLTGAVARSRHDYLSAGMRERIDFNLKRWWGSLPWASQKRAKSVG